MKILLIRLRLIGDVVFTTPLIRALRRQYPDAELTYLVEPSAAPVVVNNPHLDNVVIVPKSRGVTRIADDLSLARRLRRARFDIAIDLHGGPRAAWLTWASGAPMRIGYTTWGRSWMYTHPIERPADLSPTHSVLKQWLLLAPLGIEAADPARDAVEMAGDPAADARIEAQLHTAGITSGHRICVVHVSAGNSFRRWPAGAFVDLVARLATRDSGCRVVLTSGPSERDAAARIADDARARAGAAAVRIPVLPELDLQELRALISRAAVYIGGDSGPMHVAATTQTPIVALFGPTLPERSLPWRDARWFAEGVDSGPLPCRPCRQRVCKPGDFRCLTGITSDQVLEAVERALTAGRHGGLPLHA